MERITQKHLESALARLNANRPKDEAYNAPGRYDFEYAYGGVKLVRYCAGGGQRDISCGGFGPKRELWNFMQGMLAGVI